MGRRGGDDDGGGTVCEDFGEGCVGGRVGCGVVGVFLGVYEDLSIGEGVQVTCGWWIDEMDVKRHGKSD